jgi:hypothetical protein
MLVSYLSVLGRLSKSAAHANTHHGQGPIPRATIQRTPRRVLSASLPRHLATLILAARRTISCDIGLRRSSGNRRSRRTCRNSTVCASMRRIRLWVCTVGPELSDIHPYLLKDAPELAPALGRIRRAGSPPRHDRDSYGLRAAGDAVGQDVRLCGVANRRGRYRGALDSVITWTCSVVSTGRTRN